METHILRCMRTSPMHEQPLFVRFRNGSEAMSEAVTSQQQAAEANKVPLTPLAAYSAIFYNLGPETRHDVSARSKEPTAFRPTSFTGIPGYDLIEIQPLGKGKESPRNADGKRADSYSVGFKITVVKDDMTVIHTVPAGHYFDLKNGVEPIFSTRTSRSTKNKDLSAEGLDISSVAHAIETYNEKIAEETEKRKVLQETAEETEDIKRQVGHHPAGKERNEDNEDLEQRVNASLHAIGFDKLPLVRFLGGRFVTDERLTVAEYVYGQFADKAKLLKANENMKPVLAIEKELIDTLVAFNQAKDDTELRALVPTVRLLKKALDDADVGGTYAVGIQNVILPSILVKKDVDPTYKNKAGQEKPLRTFNDLGNAADSMFRALQDKGLLN